MHYHEVSPYITTYVLPLCPNFYLFVVAKTLRACYSLDICPLVNLEISSYSLCEHIIFQKVTKHLCERAYELYVHMEEYIYIYIKGTTNVVIVIFRLRSWNIERGVPLQMVYHGLLSQCHFVVLLDLFLETHEYHKAKKPSRGSQWAWKLQYLD